MAGGGSEKGKRRGGRRPGSKNKPKGHDLIVRLAYAEREVRKIILPGDKIPSLGEDRVTLPPPRRPRARPKKVDCIFGRRSVAREARREDCTLVAWYRSLYAPRAGGAYDGHH